MIFGSLALDMSSTKRRTTTSAYVALYTSLGFENGYKTLGNKDPTDAPLYEYYLSNDKNEFKELEKADSLKSAEFIYANDGGYLAVSMNDSIYKKCPLWFQGYCKYDHHCRFPINVISSMISITTIPPYFNVDIVGKDGKKFQFKINFTNVDESGVEPAIDLYSLPNFTERFEDLRTELSKDFSDNIHAANLDISDIIRYLKKLKDLKKKSDDVDEELKKPKKMLEEANAEHKRLTESMATIQKQIATNLKETNILVVKKIDCLHQLQNTFSEIDVEEIKNKKDRNSLDLLINENKVEKDNREKLLFYWLEASYYHRVFGEKLLKSENDVPAALLPENFVVFTNKIKNAFYPQLVTFAFSCQR
jgi:hypothetical protein